MRKLPLGVALGVVVSAAVGGWTHRGNTDK